MHYLHCYLVEIDIDESLRKQAFIKPDMVDEYMCDAKCKVEQFLENELYHVYDWYSNDTGRWSGQYPNNGIILGVCFPNLFKDLLNEWLERPKNEMRYNFQQTLKSYYDGYAFKKDYIKLDEKFLDTYYHEHGNNWLIPYRLRLVFDLLNHRYITDSYFCDIEEQQTTLSDRKYNEVMNNIYKYALVLFDIHN